MANQGTPDYMDPVARLARIRAERRRRSLAAAAGQALRRTGLEDVDTGGASQGRTPLTPKQKRKAKRSSAAAQARREASRRAKNEAAQAAAAQAGSFGARADLSGKDIQDALRILRERHPK